MYMDIVVVVVSVEPVDSPSRPHQWMILRPADLQLALSAARHRTPLGMELWTGPVRMAARNARGEDCIYVGYAALRPPYLGL